MISDLLLMMGKKSFSPLSLSPALWLKADAGLVTDGAAQFTAANSESLSSASNTLLGFGADDDFWIAGWIKPVNVTDIAPFVGRASGWDIYQVLTVIRARMGNGDVDSAQGVLSAGAWTFFIAGYDGVNDQSFISTNGGAFQTRNQVTGFTANSQVFSLGSNAGTFFNGGIDSVGAGKNPPGGIAALKTTIRDSLYNAGAGKTYNDLSAAEKTAWGLVSFWNLNELSGQRNDAHGTNHLTDNNTVTFAAGVASGSATADGDPITTWQDQSGNGRHQPTASAAVRPSLKLAIQNGRNVVRLDGVDDTFSAVNVSGSVATLFVVAAKRSAPGAGGGQTIAEFQGGTPNRAALSTYDGAHATDWVWIHDSAPGNNPLVGIPSQSWHVITISIESASVLKAYSDGVLADTINPADAAVTYTSFRISPAPTLGDFDVAEVILYTTVLTNAQRQQVESYLKSKWGTP